MGLQRELKALGLLPASKQSGPTSTQVNSNARPAHSQSRATRVVKPAAPGRKAATRTTVDETATKSSAASASRPLTRPLRSAAHASGSVRPVVPDTQQSRALRAVKLPRASERVPLSGAPKLRKPNQKPEDRAPVFNPARPYSGPNSPEPTSRMAK